MSQSHSNFAFEHLSVSERIILVQKIWDSIAEEQDCCELTDEDKAELDRRLADIDANPDAGCSWEEFKAKLQSEE